MIVDCVWAGDGNGCIVALLFQEDPGVSDTSNSVLAGLKTGGWRNTRKTLIYIGLKILY